VIGPRDWALTLVAAALFAGIIAYGVFRLYA
jgi:hypothetical protein